jgi:hypothetical protein
MGQTMNLITWRKYERQLVKVELDEKTVKQSNFPRNRAVIVSVHLKR